MQRPASRTAVGVALARALHQTFDAAPRVLDDPVAPLFFTRAQLEAARLEDREGTRLLRSHVVLRSRWAEERAVAAVARGCRAMCVLGAGWDSASIRLAPELGVPVLEVDHPASQAEKVARLAAAGVDVPAGVSFVGVDFATQSIEDGLRAHLPQGPAVFLCLGVIMYLQQKDITALFAFVAKQQKGSELVLSFAPSSPRFGVEVAFHSDLAGSAAPAGEARPVHGAMAQAAAVGEVWHSLHTQEGLEAELRTAGFSEVKALSLEEARAYFGELPRADSLPPPARVSVLAAIV
jgi:methyltransferase (TIGR00027 family)